MMNFLSNFSFITYKVKIVMKITEVNDVDYIIYSYLEWDEYYRLHLYDFDKYKKFGGIVPTGQDIIDKNYDPIIWCKKAYAYLNDNNYFELIKYLGNTITDEQKKTLFDSSFIYYGNLDIITFYSEQYVEVGCKCPFVSCIHYKFRGHLLITYRRIENAIYGGFVNILKYLYDEHDFAFNDDNVKLAIQRGKINVLKYFYKIGVLRVTEKYIIYAFNTNKLGIIKYFYSIDKSRNKELFMNTLVRFRIDEIYEPTNPKVLKFLKKIHTQYLRFDLD